MDAERVRDAAIYDAVSAVCGASVSASNASDCADSKEKDHTATAAHVQIAR